MRNIANNTFKARNFRRNQTNLEWLLWQQLRRKQLDGVKFRRQQPIGNYIVDFVSCEKKLIIEVDGETHSKEFEVVYDKNRTAYLESLGYTVLRFWNNEVTRNIESVLKKVRCFAPLSSSLPIGERTVTTKPISSVRRLRGSVGNP